MCSPTPPLQCGSIHRRDREPTCTDFSPPGAHRAAVVFGGDYEDGRRVHSSGRAQPVPAQVTRHGL
jgi:hypothetical protein